MDVNLEASVALPAWIVGVLIAGWVYLLGWALWVMADDLRRGDFAECWHDASFIASPFPWRVLVCLLLIIHRISEPRSKEPTMSPPTSNPTPQDDHRKKVEHVRRAVQTRDHPCHWPGCTQQVPPARWGCQKHWRLLPQRLRMKLWEAYRIGQEEDGNPSREYVRVAKEIRRWIKDTYGDRVP